MNYKDDMTSHGIGATVFTIAHGCYVPMPMDAHWSDVLWELCYKRL